ncbi:MAG: hypothetical protein Q9217_005902 [Psora testacea]
MVVGQILWVSAVFFLRASILSLYVHIFGTKSFRITCYIVHAFNAVYFAATVLACCLICRPISANWNRKAGSCGNQKSLDLFIGIFNLLMDVCVVVLPMPVLWRLQLSTGKKLVLTGIFGMGVVICVVTLVRIWVTTLIHGTNAQKIYSIIALLTCLEALLGTINTCFPVMRPVFTKLGTSKFWSSFISSITGRTSKRSFFSSSTWNRSGKHPSKSGNGTGGRGGEEIWSKPCPKEHPAPRFVDAKAAHPMQSLVAADGASRTPPQSLSYQSENPRWEEKKVLGVVVRRDWDTERADSAETDRRPLNKPEGRYNQAWSRDLSFGTIVFAVFGTGSQLAGQIALGALSDSKLCLMLYTGIFAIPTLIYSLSQTLDRLSWLSIPSVISIIVAGVFGMVTAGIHFPIAPFDVVVTTNFTSAFISVTNPVVAYAGHFMFFILISEMKHPVHAMRAVWVLQIFATTFYAVFAVFLYIYVGSKVKSPAFSSLPIKWQKAAYGIAIPNCLIAGSLYSHTAAKLLVWFFRKSKHLQSHTVIGWDVWIFLIILMNAAAFVLAVDVPIFNYLIGILASLFASWYTYGIAGAFWLYDSWMYKGKASAWRGRWPMTGLSVATIIAGAFIGVAGMYVSVKQIVGAYGSG